jgi:hypothetical protein
VGWRFAGECGVWVAFALPKRHPLEALRHKGLRRVWHVWRFIWALSAYRSEVEHHLPARSFQIKVKNKRLKRHTCLKALQDKGFACGVLFAQTPHMPPKRHTLGRPTDRAGSMSEPAPVPPWPPRGHHRGHHRVSPWPRGGHHSYRLPT